MKQLLQFNREKSPRVESVPEPQLRGRGIIVDTAASLISVGTERQMIELSQMNLMAKARQRPEIVKQVIEKARTEGIVSTYNKVMSRLKTPTSLGYSSAGTIREVHQAVDRFSVGQRVACAGAGYATHAETAFIPTNLAVAIPDNVSFEDASFVTLGAIALQGVRIAEARLGETVAVIGLGLLGQITCQLLSASGCRVIGIDLDQTKIDLAVKLGATAGLPADNSTICRILDLTAGKGVDAVVITAASDSSAPIELAGEIAREKGKVVVVGAVKMDVPRQPYYMKELELRLSRSYGPGRYDYHYEQSGQDYPFGYVRWTENRNMESFLQLISNGRVNVNALISHRFEIADAGQAYDLILNDPTAKPLGVVLSYPSHQNSTVHLITRMNSPVAASRITSSDIGVGFIGAGNFATGVLLPNLSAISGYKLRSIMSGGGVSAASAAAQFHFAKTTDSVSELLKDSDITAVFIASRHDQHAELVVNALRAGKPTFVEKPLCLTEDELTAIEAAYVTNSAPLMVGFNRRFAPLVSQIKQHVETLNFPVSMHYRINAGFIPDNHWVQDSEAGGGRVIGEVCHFVDLMSFLTDATPVRVFAEPLTMPDSRYRPDDNLQIVIKFSDGSVGTINYIASGNKLMPKESLEILGGGLAARLDDFKTLSLADQKGLHLKKERAQDKGHRAMLEQWGKTILQNDVSPISFASLTATTRATLAIMQSLSLGEPIWLNR
jgi:predicted dehydrogenase/threonine dehydrogenase-like Zn-dependent dehydrogenase